VQIDQSKQPKEEEQDQQMLNQQFQEEAHNHL
jgi:hypothetical protein